MNMHVYIYIYIFTYYICIHFYSIMALLTEENPCIQRNVRGSREASLN